MGFSTGGGTKTYQSKNIPTYEDWASSGIANRAGIRKVANPAYNSYMQGQSGGSTGAGPLAGTSYAGTGYGSYGTNEKTGQQVGGGKAPSQYIYDTSNVGGPISMAEATAPYQKNFDLLNEANQGFRNPEKLTQTYVPATLNYQGLPTEYGNKAYEAGAKDVRRQGQGDLEAIKEAIGVRRPGLLLKAGEQSQRDVAENLANMRNNIDLNVMNQNVGLGVQQQQDQAGENYKGYQSRADLEKANSDNAYRYLQGLQGGASGAIGLQSGIQNQAQTQQDQALQYLMNLYLGSADAMKGSKGSFGINKG